MPQPGLYIEKLGANDVFVLSGSLLTAHGTESVTGTAEETAKLVQRLMELSNE